MSKIVQRTFIVALTALGLVLLYKAFSGTKESETGVGPEDIKVYQDGPKLTAQKRNELAKQYMENYE